MSSLHRRSRPLLLACFLLLALVAAAVAYGGRGDPQEKLTPADNGRARAIVVRKSDLERGFKASPTSLRKGGSFHCDSLDVSDLVVTGKAASPVFTAAPVTVVSSVVVYRTIADADTAWRRAWSAAGWTCMRRQAKRIGAVSFGEQIFPRFGQRSKAFSLIHESGGRRVYSSAVLIQHGRAVAALIHASAGRPVRWSDVVRVGRAVAARMKTAMRGA